jgi:hypothetical protein
MVKRLAPRTDISVCISTVVTREVPSPSREANSSRPRRNRSLYRASNDSRWVNICRMAPNSRPITLLPQQHFIGLYLKRNKGKYLPLFKKYHAQMYVAVKASLHVPSMAPHGHVIGLPPLHSVFGHPSRPNAVPN